MERLTVNIATDGSGDFTGYTKITNGLVHAVRFVDTDLAAGADITVTCGASGAAIVTLTNQANTATVAPRQATHDTAGAALLYAAGGTAVSDLIPVADEAIKVVVAQGGATATGTLHIYVG